MILKEANIMNNPNKMLSKRTMKIHLFIVLFYALFTVIICFKYNIDPISPFTRLIVIYFWSGIVAWVLWKTIIKSEKTINVLFNVLFLLVFASQLITPILKNYSTNVQNTEDKSVHFKIEHQEDSSISNAKELAKNGSENIEDKVRRMELAIREEIKRLGHPAETVQLYDVFEMGSEYSVFCFLYKDNDLFGAYFYCPEANRYILYNTVEDMDQIAVFESLDAIQKKNWIRENFAKLAGFSFPI